MQIQDNEINKITLKINGVVTEDPGIVANNFNNYYFC